MGNLVPSLPTRNGNEPYRHLPKRRRLCSQPTYKEWKQAKWAWLAKHAAGFPAYLQGMETVFRLPWRPDGILRSQPTYKEWKLNLSITPGAVSCRFPAYLQGMET